ncbi:MAG: hypothetical protein QXR02_06635 [Acidilobaceae archaeon]
MSSNILNIIGYLVSGLGSSSSSSKEYFFGSLATEFRAFASASYNNFLRLRGDIMGSHTAISSARRDSLGSLAYAGFFAEGRGGLDVDARGSTRAGIRSNNTLVGSAWSSATIRDLIANELKAGVMTTVEKGTWMEGEEKLRTGERLYGGAFIKAKNSEKRGYITLEGEAGDTARGRARGEFSLLPRSSDVELLISAQATRELLREGARREVLEAVSQVRARWEKGLVLLGGSASLESETK